MNWKKYEDEVYYECTRIYNDAEIIRNTYVDGIYSKHKRQIDVLIKNALVEGVSTTIIVDAKFYNKKVDVKEVESFISMLKDTGADKGIIVTECGFTKTAINRAHLGENNIEADIYCLQDFKQFQSLLAIPYSGSYGSVIQSPFGWIIDGKRNIQALATLYKRGYSFEEACKNKEFMYINYWIKDEEVASVDDLIKYQNKYIIDHVPNAIINVDESEFKIRSIKDKSYPATEYTGYREFDDFILFIVLFSPENISRRDINKMKFVLNSALPIRVRQQ